MMWIMMGYKIRNLKTKTFTSFSLENLVPENNFYRHVEQCIDLSFVRDLVRHLYSDFGRPSIDPVVFLVAHLSIQSFFFKLQQIAFFEGIRSERFLMKTVNLNMAHRWFTGYDLDEAVPDHSSLSKIRERHGMQTFHQFFEQSVELCVEAGLVWGEELYFDSTKVNANAAIKSMIDRTESEVDQHLEELWKNSEDCASPETLQDLVDKYNGE
jgi:transposase